MVEAALTLDLSIRHHKRLKTRYRDEGIAAIVHGNRGRHPWNAVADVLAERIVELARTTYAGLNHSHLADLLAEREGINLERSTIRRLLVRAGSPSPRSPGDRRSNHSTAGPGPIHPWRRWSRRRQSRCSVQVTESLLFDNEGSGTAVELCVKADLSTGTIAATSGSGLWLG